MNQIAKTHNPTMSSREIAELTGKRHHHVVRDVRAMIDALGDEPDLGHLREEKDARGYTSCFHLDRYYSEVLVTGYDVHRRAAVIRRWMELEQKAAPSLPDFNDPIAAAEAWIEAKKAEQVAIATKAEIGSRREATAMATASTATRRANQLERDLDRSKDYCTIKRMSMLTHGQKYNWRLLKSASQDLGIPAIDVFDANYGTVKAYHADVWMEAYGLEVVA
ncbi:Rha family transcriptional regulator [uncultured Halomonas sp.]|uniref:Rha family transcriptional regulator n=1 Tax=uncultured Halomonas sp. TaxID=173971 RepID=UPI00261732F0|nr:Rha family transcriptional regulator [uncultured Halomonas sp.]